MDQQTIILHIDPLLLLGLTGAGFGSMIWVIWALLRANAKMTIDGIFDHIKRCESGLVVMIDKSNAKAENAFNHAEAAHVKIGVVQRILMNHGVDSLEKH